MVIQYIRKSVRVLSRFTVVLFILFIASAAAFAWSYMNYQKAKNQLAGGQITQQQVKRVTRAVARLIVLPDGNPTVAVIKDISVLADQPFFKNAHNGDFVLVYAEQAIIYSSKRHMLVNVGPVIGNPAGALQQTATSQDVAADIIVEVRNGSTTAGRAGIVGDEIDNINGYTVATTTNAKNKNYKGTTIINLSGKDVSALEEKFDVKAVPDLPTGESSSQADVVVILGN